MGSMMSCWITLIDHLSNCAAAAITGVWDGSHEREIHEQKIKGVEIGIGGQTK